MLYYAANIGTKCNNAIGGGKSVLKALLFFGKRNEKGGKMPRRHAKCDYAAKV